MAALIQKPDGKFYGTTQFQGTGPSYYGGRVFEMTADGTVTSVHDFTNLRVNDASLLPDAPGVNPQAAVMTIALRNADHFLADG